MNYTISNSRLTVEISDRGGELRSIQDETGKEYLWQGDKKVWEDRAPNLFPYIGRMTEKSYRFQGKTYHMDIHGFLPTSDMELESKTDDCLTLKLKASEETLEKYPFLFELEITWKLYQNKLEITYQVKNKDKNTMYFGIGGHPGFIVPVEETKRFEDYCIDFGEESHPRRVAMSEDCFVLEGDELLELSEGRYLKLRHDLFDHDAIILKDIPEAVRLGCAEGKKEVVVSFPQMTYLGIWHRPFQTPEYVCIEPWSSLPSRKGVKEDIAKQPGLVFLESGDVYRNTWSITIEEKQNKNK